MGVNAIDEEHCFWPFASHKRIVQT